MLPSLQPHASARSRVSCTATCPPPAPSGPRLKGQRWLKGKRATRVGAARASAHTPSSMAPRPSPGTGGMDTPPREAKVRIRGSCSPLVLVCVMARPCGSSRGDKNHGQFVARVLPSVSVRWLFNPAEQGSCRLALIAGA